MTLVYKFGGSSLVTSSHIRHASKIILDGWQDTSSETVLVCVLSALGDTTDQLYRITEIASQGPYQTQLSLLFETWNGIIQELFPEGYPPLEKEIHLFQQTLERLGQGIYLLGDVSDKIKNQFVSYGEIVTQSIVYHFLSQQNEQVGRIDTRQCIQTHSHFGHTKVYEKTKIWFIKTHT